MGEEIIRVEGVRELLRALRACERELARDLTRELRAVGEIVRDDERGYLSRIEASRKAIGGIRVQVRGGSVAVQQRYSTVTGKRGDWGARIMSSLATARSRRRADVERRLELMLDRIGDRF